MTGEVSNVEEYLQAADIFVFPSRREGMPNVVPEAFASGTPTVLAPFVGLPEEFGRAGTHYVLANRTATDLADAIIALLASPQRREELAGEARRWVESKLDLERSLMLYASLYCEIAQRTTLE
jgi:glycosyltransferase involved in cell wall biosynthesis